jgi:hypothetical protein
LLSTIPFVSESTVSRKNPPLWREILRLCNEELTDS